MTLEILEKDLAEARKTKSIIKKDVLISAINAVKNAAIAKNCKDNITEELVRLGSHISQLREFMSGSGKEPVQESIDTCPDDRMILKTEYLFKMDILNKYCPKLLTDIVEIRDIIYKELAAAGIEAKPENLNMAMKIIMPKFKGKADMRVVNQAVRDIMQRKEI